jgi:hypothetical protein
LFAISWGDDAVDHLHEQIRRVRRRLIWEQFLSRSVWCLFVALIFAAVAIALPRLFVISSLTIHWESAWLLSALAGGLLVAAIWTFFTRHSALAAAIEIDRRFELRERLSSSLSLTPEDQASEAGQAVVRDAARAASRINVDEKFRVRLDRRAWWPLAPAAIAFVLVAFVDNRQAASSIDPNSAASAEKQTKTAVESLRKKIAERAKEAKEHGLKAAEDVFKQIEQGTRDLTEQKDVDRTKAAVKLNDLASTLDQRRQELGAGDELKKQLQNMKNLGAGPAEKAAQALKEGDWKKALEEVEKLQQELREGKLDAAARQQLADQLDKMREKLEAAADAHQQAAEDLKKEIEQQKQKGDLAKAGQLQEKLDQLQQQQPQMDRLARLAHQIGQIQQGLKQSDIQQAADAMTQMAQQLDQMQQEMNELEMLDAAMNQLEMAKDAMACPQCNGQGCQACQGGQFGNNMNGPPGMGMGAGRGIGPRPDEKNPTNLRDTRVRQDPGRGAATFGGMVEGPNVRGDVAESIKEEMSSLGAEPADPITSERLPRASREHAEDYFRMLREGR